MTHTHQVTNTAVVRFLELAYGLDIETIRSRIAVLAETGIREGATGIITEGVKLIVLDGRVVNVVHRRTPSCHRASGPPEA